MARIQPGESEDVEEGMQVWKSKGMEIGHWEKTLW